MNKTSALIIFSLLFILISSCFFGTVCAEEVVLSDGSVISVEPLYEDINSLPPGKEVGKEIIISDIYFNEDLINFDFIYLSGKMLSEIYLLFVDTPFRKAAQWITFIIFTISGTGLLLFIFRFAAKEKKKSKTREKILDCIQDNPGSQEKDIVSDLKISRGSASYQLLKLKSEKRIYADSSLGHKRYFPCSVKPDTVKGKLYAVSRNPKCENLITILRENESLSRKEIAELMKMPQSAVYRYLKILQGNELLMWKYEGRNIFYSLTDEARNQWNEIISANKK